MAPIVLSHIVENRAYAQAGGSRASLSHLGPLAPGRLQLSHAPLAAMQDIGTAAANRLVLTWWFVIIS